MRTRQCARLRLTVLRCEFVHARKIDPVAALPVILAYVLLTKQFIRGLTAGALKG